MIYWLEITRSAKHLHHLSNHYILKVNQKFMVFTSSKNIKGAQTLFVSENNIDKKPVAQHIFEKIHEYDASVHITKLTQNCIDYLNANSTKIQPFIEKMSQITEKIT